MQLLIFSQWLLIDYFFFTFRTRSKSFPSSFYSVPNNTTPMSPGTRLDEDFFLIDWQEKELTVCLKSIYLLLFTLLRGTSWEWLTCEYLNNFEKNVSCINVLQTDYCSDRPKILDILPVLWTKCIWTLVRYFLIIVIIASLLYSLVIWMTKRSILKIIVLTFR